MNRISDKTYEQFYRELFDELKIQIASEKDDYIIAQPTDDLVKYYLRNALQPIEFDNDREESINHEKYIKTIYSHQREWGYQQDGDLKVECEKIVVKLPILPNRNIQQIFNLRTNSISLSGGPQFTISGNNIIIEVEIKGYGINLSNEQISSTLLSTKSAIKNLLQTKNAEISSENLKLKSQLEQFIETRKSKLDSDKKRLEELVKMVKIPLERKSGDIVKKVQIDRKPFIQKIKPKTPEEDYKLDREKVIDIIKLIDNQCLQFEKTPKTYEKFNEPNLRDLILANLNSVFEGKATGETFNNKGKTDIYLNIDKGNILVAECKIYGGQQLYHDTIDQLLRYLTWRQNFGIMISFCKNKNFSKIIEDSEAIIKTHDSFDSEFKQIDDSHFISKHTLPGDEYKYIEIHHLYYNLYVEKN